MSRIYKIATRGSKLALWQANAVKDALEKAHPGIEAEIVVVKTTGDKVTDRPLDQIGDKGMFTKELENALVSGEADMCVHSMKDVPSKLFDGCEIAAMLPREDVRDALVLGSSLEGVASLDDLPAGARIGSGSLRRVAQLKAGHPQVEVVPIRGNVDTRVAKAMGQTGEGYDGAILAAAGLKRMGLDGDISAYIPVDEMIPAAGQGAVGVEILSSDAELAGLLSSIDDVATHVAVDAERYVLDAMGGSCKVPLGAHVRECDGELAFDAIALTLDGGKQARVHETAACGSDDGSMAQVALGLARKVVEELEEQGAREILASVLESGDADAADPSRHPVQLGGAESGDAPMAAAGAGAGSDATIAGTEADGAAGNEDRADGSVADMAAVEVSPAKVYLVGSGPGDPGLATTKSVALVEGASIIVYDYLGAEALLSHASPDAEILYVGKKGYSKHVTQDEINALLVQKACELGARGGDGSRAAGTRKADPYIVRLKGGDPFVFGRGGEEALALVDAGIPFEVVPGVTSGIAAPAYAGIPVTHRKVASSVTFVTGHEDPTRTESSIDWTALGRLAAKGDTLCLYMGMHSLGAISERLVDEGAPSSTPVALVRWGTTERQQTLTGTLDDIASKAEEADFGAPAIIVVGQVVELRSQLAWFEDRPLFGKRIVVTRTRTQAGVLSKRLADEGASVIEFPTIELADPTSYDAIDRALQDLPGYDWVIFTSVNGVDRFFSRLESAETASGPRDARALCYAKTACIGSATASRLAEHGIKADLVPSEYKAEGVFAAMEEQGELEGQRILIPRAEVARETLPDLLRQAGAEVDVAPVYRTVPPSSEHAEELRQMLEDGEVDAVTFTSSSTAENFFSVLGDDAAQLLGGVDLCSIGPVTTATIEKAGLSASVESDPYTIPALVSAICDLYAGGEGCGEKRA